LDSDKVLKTVRRNSARVLSELVFDPDSWKGRSDKLTFENERLSEGRLREYAKLASEVRKRLQEKIESAKRSEQGVEVLLGEASDDMVTSL